MTLRYQRLSQARWIRSTNVPRLPKNPMPSFSKSWHSCNNSQPVAPAPQPGEHSPIAIILCSDKDAEVVELMDLEQDTIHVAEYWLNLPPKEALQAKLHKAMLEAKARLEFQRNGGDDE